MNYIESFDYGKIGLKTDFYDDILKYDFEDLKIYENFITFYYIKHKSQERVFIYFNRESILSFEII